MNKIVTLCCLVLGLLGFSQDSITTKKRLKIDGVSAVVGDYVILESDVDKAYIELESQGVSTADVSRCNLLGKLMEDKLYAHHAEQDSIEVNNDDINNYVEQTIDYFVRQFGDIEKVLEFYKKKDEQSFRAELFEVNRIQQLSQRMQSKIVEDVEVTPDEVKVFSILFQKKICPFLALSLKWHRL
jgi:peptidyl-prolyl cis-trans isomerase SurA